MEPVSYWWTTRPYLPDAPLPSDATTDVVIIMLGLAIGAMFVRSLTVFLVHKGTLQEFVYLEHGAHYAIGILALIMFARSVWLRLPPIVT